MLKKIKPNFFHFYRSLIGPLPFGQRGPINSSLSACLSVTVRDTFLRIFYMKLEIHKGSKVTKPDFSLKIHFPRFWAKMAQMSLFGV